MDDTKLNIRVTVYLSFGFFAVSLVWSLYNSVMPLLLDSDFHYLNNFQVGAIMVIANIAALVLEPTFGRISDRTHTRFGRRLPYIMVGIPIAAVSLALLPRMGSLAPMLAVLILFCFVMAMWRTPVVSLMPDLTPGPLRSQANGIVNMLGGIGSLLAFVGGGTLLKIGVAPGARPNYQLSFLVAAVVMLLALAVLVTKVREPAQAFAAPVGDTRSNLNLSQLDPAKRRSLFLLLSAIFFWFVAYNAVEVYFTKFAHLTLGVSAGNAPIILGTYAVAFLAFAVPAGMIGARVGRRNTMLVGLAGIVLCFIPMVMGTNVVMTIVCLVLGGLFWACININSLPMVLRMGDDNMVGTFTGLYYLFSVAAAIIGPPVAGWLIDLAGKHQILFIQMTDNGNYRILFLYCAVAFLIALVILTFVHHGEEAARAPLPEGPIQAMA